MSQTKIEEKKLDLIGKLIDLLKTSAMWFGIVFVAYFIKEALVHLAGKDTKLDVKALFIYLSDLKGTDEGQWLGVIVFVALAISLIVNVVLYLLIRRARVNLKNVIETKHTTILNLENQCGISNRSSSGLQLNGDTGVGDL